MEAFLKFCRFMATGRTDPKTDDELREERLERTSPRMGGMGVIFIGFCLLAIIGKFVIQALTGRSVDLSVRGLVGGFSILVFASLGVFAIVLLRKLFAWRYESEPRHELEKSSGCGMIVLIIAGLIGLVTLYARHSYEASQKAKAAASQVERERMPPPAGGAN